MQDLQTEAQAVAQLAAKPFIQTVGAIPVIFTPSDEGGWRHEIEDRLLPNPERKKGNTQVHTAESFIDIVKAHGAAEESAIYFEVDYEARKFIARAVLNDHQPGQSGNAGWRDHRATFSPRMGIEWERWVKNNDVKMSQIQLARFLEDNIDSIVSPEGSTMPTGAQVLEFVSKLEDTRTVKYGQGINLQNGLVQLEFVEKNDDATRGKLEIFKQFCIGVAPFFGGSGYQLKAHLRYEINRNSGEITFYYVLHRPDRVMEDAGKDVIAKIASAVSIPVLYGSPA